MRENGGVTGTPDTSYEQDEAWRKILTGELGALRPMRAVLGRIPAEPRCKLCAAPFGNPGNLVLRFLGFGPSKLNRRLCRMCFHSVARKPGGAEVELSMLFADVRGSTTLAERMPAQEFSRLMARFYGAAAQVVDRADGIVDKFVGDEIVALFVPGFVKGNHAEQAVSAAHELLERTGEDIPVGAAVHTGIAFVGRVGEGDACDFTALGDAVNTTARLASAAGAGEILVSTSAASAAAMDTEGLESRRLDLRGREEAVAAWVVTA